MKYDFSKNIGHSDLICQNDGDQGDTCQRVGTFYFLASILNIQESYRGKEIVTSFIQDAYNLSSNGVRSGRFRRHNNPSAGWYSDRQLSRDQKSILMLAFAQFGFKGRLYEAFKDNASRLFFHQNTLADDGKSFQFPDVMVPNEFSAIIRGLDMWYLIPFLYVLDISFILEVMFFRNTKPWDYDNMLAQQLFYAQIKYPTFISKYTYKIYQNTNFLERLKKYHKDFANGIPAIYDMFVDVNNKLKGYI